MITKKRMYDDEEAANTKRSNNNESESESETEMKLNHLQP